MRVLSVLSMSSLRRMLSWPSFSEDGPLSGTVGMRVDCAMQDDLLIAWDCQMERQAGDELQK
jgi:hypothetical protein